ncbi:MAG TPA: glycosyltransferase family 39 protein [Solirubrobacterales bacterium]
MSGTTPHFQGLAARNGGWFGLAVLAAILLLGLGLRLDYAWEGTTPVYDALAYERIAANLERGEGFDLGTNATQPASNYSPGVPLLAGTAYELSGGVHERHARLVLALIGALAVLFTYLIGRRLSGPAAGLIGAAAVAIYPSLLEYQGMLMGEPLAATLLSGAVLAMLWAASRQDPPARWLVPGLLLGALALVRPEYLGIGLVLAVVILAWSRDRWRIGVANAAILLAGVVLVVAPWTVRNAIALDRFVPISTGGGQVLFAGSYLPSGGDPERVGAEVLERHPGLTRKLSSRLVPDSATNRELSEGLLRRLRLEQILAALADQRYPGMETDEALARMGRERLWDDLGERPLDYGGFVAAKVWRAWSHGPRRVMERPGWEIFHWALIGLGLLGLVVLARERPREALLLGVLLVAVTAIVALLVASPRRVLVTIPIVAALAGVGASWLVDRSKEGRRTARVRRRRSATLPG